LEPSPSYSPSPSSLQSKSFQVKVNEKLDSLANQLSEFMSKCKITAIDRR
jgi:hypothetical protein